MLVPLHKSESKRMDGSFEGKKKRTNGMYISLKTSRSNCYEKFKLCFYPKIFQLTFLNRYDGILSGRNRSFLHP